MLEGGVVFVQIQSIAVAIVWAIGVNACLLLMLVRQRELRKIKNVRRTLPWSQDSIDPKTY